MARKTASSYFAEHHEHLRIISSCPVCNGRYAPGVMRVLEEKNDAHLVYLKCRRCQASVLAVVLANQLGVSSVGLVTDLDSADVLRVRRYATVTADDVLDVHAALTSDGFLRHVNAR